MAEKLHKLKQLLVLWNKKQFGNIFTRLRKKEEDVIRGEVDLENLNSPGNQEKYRKLFLELDDLLNKEEVYRRQKSRCKWNLEGERNTKFFNNMVQRKWNKQKILSVVDDNGQIMSEQGQLKASVVNYFERLISSPRTLDSTTGEDIARVIEHLDSEEMNTTLCGVPSLEKIKKAVFGLNREATAGPDGFSAYFFQFC